MKRLVVTSLMLAPFISAASEGEISTQIYNGSSASTTEFPSYAALYFDAIDYGYNQYGQYCGATILDEQHVLTAAHCIFDGNGNVDEEVVLFTNIVPQLGDENDYFNSTSIRGAKFYAHSGYVDSSSSVGTSWPNDIAIIKLATTMNVDSSAHVDLASSTDAVTYRASDTVEFTAVGLGLIEALSTNSSTELLKTTLNYDSICGFSNVSDSQLCMSGVFNATTEVRNSTCSGDSGGPVYWHDGSGFKQAGIVSYGWEGCYWSLSDSTSVHTEVADYSTWIADVIAGNAESDLVYTATDSARSAYEFSGGSNLVPSGSSGGSAPLWALLSLTGLAFYRRKRK